MHDLPQQNLILARKNLIQLLMIVTGILDRHWIPVLLRRTVQVADVYEIQVVDRPSTQRLLCVVPPEFELEKATRRLQT